MNAYSSEWNAMNKPRVTILNAPVYQKLLYVEGQLERFAAQTPGIGSPEVILKPELHLGRIYFTAPYLEMLPAWLLQVISEKADECEAYEKSGGGQRLCVTFHRLFISMR